MATVLPAIQQAIYSRLVNDAALMSMVTGVFDHVPEGQAFPFITIGEGTSVPFRTQTRFGEEVTVTMHIWSRYKGFAEALEILSELNRLLADKEIPVPGFGTAISMYEFSETLRDPDGVTRHVPVRYRFVILHT